MRCRFTVPVATMLWIALHLPSLSLETFSATLSEGQAEEPIALLRAHRVVGANAAARSLGVQPGLRRATARSLAPQLTFGEADPVRDAEALTTVAHAALAFTPSVSIPAPSPAADTEPLHTVLLEVQASLRYFGGLSALRQRLHAALAPLGHRLQTASAPTPLGAALLARVHADLHCADLASVHAALDAAPVWLLGPARTHWEALQGMGLRRISDLRRLPRSGLARRFGEAVLDEVDRAFGLVPDPREPISLPPVFESRLELFARADTTAQVLHGAGLLVARLVAWLSAQHASARRFTLVMAHEPRRRALETPSPTALSEPVKESGVSGRTAEKRPIEPVPGAERAFFGGTSGHVGFVHKFSGEKQSAGTVSRPDSAPQRPSATPLEVALAEPSRDPKHLLGLLRERLAQIELAAPTLDLHLHCADIARLPPPNTELFPTPRGEREGLTRLIERLQARLGPAQVQRLREVPDHRPERATEVVCADAAGLRPGTPRARSAERAAAVESQTSFPMRPVWVLPEAEPLQEKGAGPLLAGRPLRLVSGPERIESGWWDGGLAERDYFIAQDTDGALVWIYRSRLLSSTSVTGWFLHGRFG